MTRYSDPRYDIRHIHQFPTVVDFAAATGINLGPASRTNMFHVPFKAKVVKFGIIPTTGSVIFATADPVFCLKLETNSTTGATQLATYRPGKYVTAATLTPREATGCAPETATNIPKGRTVMPCILSAGGSSGSCLFFMEYQEVYETA